MKILLFEWLTGGGMWGESLNLESAGHLLDQGIAMVSAVGQDLTKFAQVDWLVDSRLIASNALDGLDTQAAAHLRGLTGLVDVHSVDSLVTLKSKLRSLAKDADSILLIAPETDACLANSIRWLGEQQHKLISPALDFVVATSDKNRLAKRLDQCGFYEIPQGTDLESFLKLPTSQQIDWFPIVVKPADGAGSEGVKYFDETTELRDWLLQNSAIQLANFRAEHFVAGTSASIAAICRGDHEPIFFPAMEQILHPPPVGEYLRSEDCLSDSQQLRAKQLAAKAIACLPNTTGFIGLDIVLADDPVSGKDVLIEVNPRITMSYLKLSQMLDDGQIARMMLGDHSIPNTQT